MRSVTILIAVLAAVLVALAAGLRPDAFYAGDPGVKLTAALNAADHPSHPLDITLPTIGGIAVPHVDPFFAVHGDHAHAVTAELFPVMTAPFLRAFGLRGAYVLPAAGFLLAVFGCAWLAPALDPRRRPLFTALAAAFGTPWLFYGLELWEHAPAVGLAALSLALFVSGRGMLAGLCMGVAILLRAEAVWLAASVFAVAPLLPKRPRLETIASAAAGGALVAAPYAFFLWRHHGTLVPPHLGANANILADTWLQGRLTLAATWLGASNASLWRFAPALWLAALPFLPLASSALATADRPLAGRVPLALIALANLVLVMLTAPNTGGAQWGPRYLLFSFIPLAVLAGDAIAALASRRTAIPVLVVVASTAVLIERASYRELRGTKNIYGRVVDFVNAQSADGEYVVSDVWWLDQIAASAAERRRWLFVPDNAEGRGVVARLSNHMVPSVTTIRLGKSAPTDWLEGTCYVVDHTASLPEQDLVALGFQHRCPGTSQGGRGQAARTTGAQAMAQSRR